MFFLLKKYFKIYILKVETVYNNKCYEKNPTLHINFFFFATDNINEEF